jgi:hypothetical protein
MSNPLPLSDGSDCQVVIDLTIKSFAAGFAKGIVSLADGTLVNVQIVINKEKQ